jgi:hypothetical protein
MAAERAAVVDAPGPEELGTGASEPLTITAA